MLLFFHFMNKSHREMSFFLPALLIIVLFVSPSQIFAMARHPANQAVNEAAVSKMDLRLREALRQDDKSKKIDIIIKTASPASEDQKVILKTAGFTSRTWIGAIATGSTRLKNVEDIAQLDFVKALELATPLTPKKP